MATRALAVLSTRDVAGRAAAFVADRARAAVAERGAFSLALSRLRPPVLAALAAENLLWEAVTVFQVDERVAPRGDAERNLTQLEALSRANVVAMPVDDEDLEAAAERYAQQLPDRLDLVHLGLGADGHTASLIPGDDVLAVVDRDVGVTREYQGRRRMTLTYPAIDRAREALWVVTGDEKLGALQRLLADDPTIPAARVRTAAQTVLTDQAVTYS